MASVGASKHYVINSTNNAAYHWHANQKQDLWFILKLILKALLSARDKNEKYSLLVNEHNLSE